MAVDSNLRSVTNTLTGAGADAITLLQLWPAIEVTNHDAATALFIRQDGVVAVAEADGASIVPPASSKVFKATPSAANANQILVSIVGNGNKYTIEGVQ